MEAKNSLFQCDWCLSGPVFNGCSTIYKNYSTKW